MSLPFDRVFQEQGCSDCSFTGFLLVDHGKAALADERSLAAVYGESCLRVLDFSLENLDTPEAAYPGLFLARHTLELYLKGLVPDWEIQRNKQNRHQIDYLVEILMVELTQTYDTDSVDVLTNFLRQFAMLDPKSMAFRYKDGAIASFGSAPLEDPEIWIDFQALKEALRLSFDALDRVWLSRSNNEGV